MTHMERFKQSDLWRSYERFTLANVSQLIGVPKTVAVDIVARLGPELTRTVGRQRKTTYQRVSSAHEWIRKPWRIHTDEELGITEDEL